MATATPATSDPNIGKQVKGCLKAFVEVLAAVAAITILPLIVLLTIMHWAWPWYSSASSISHSYDNALIALASVAGVLWSGAIIAYSIHKKYTPPLRTGVQLLNFGILAPLVGLIGAGASLRTAFYFAAWFYLLDTVFSMTNRALLKPGTLKFLTPRAKPNETSEEIQQRVKLLAAEDQSTMLFKRIAHGTRYFAIVSAFCIVIFILANPLAIAWACLAVLVMSLLLMLPEIFALSTPTSTSSDAQGPNAHLDGTAAEAGFERP